jgi:hypothetical protein
MSAADFKFSSREDGKTSMSPYFPHATYSSRTQPFPKGEGEINSILLVQNSADFSKKSSLHPSMLRNLLKTPNQRSADSPGPPALENYVRRILLKRCGTLRAFCPAYEVKNHCAGGFVGMTKRWDNQKMSLPRRDNQPAGDTCRR